jgi:hypothetical protein
MDPKTVVDAASHGSGFVSLYPEQIVRMVETLHSWPDKNTAAP